MPMRRIAITNCSTRARPVDSAGGAGYSGARSMTTHRVFFGWRVVAAFAVIVFLSTGMRFTIGP
jgi:hypothetical protein